MATPADSGGGLLAAYLLFLSILSILGNAATLAVALATGAVRCTNRVFFIAQAVVDLLTGCLLCPLAAAAQLRPDGAAMRDGRWGCEAAAYCAILLLQLAAYLLLAASCDHFAAFRWPGRYPTVLSRTRSACWLGALAALSLLVCLPTAVSHDRAGFSNSTLTCFVNWDQESSYHLAVCAVVVLPALVAVCVTNGYLLTPDFRRKRVRYLAFEAEQVTPSEMSNSGAVAFEDTRESFYRDVFAASTVQLITWIAWGSVQIADASSDDQVPPAAIFFTFWTAVGNCAWRFLVHCACLRDFRLGLRLAARALLRACCRFCRPWRNGSGRSAGSGGSVIGGVGDSGGFENGVALGGRGVRHWTTGI